MEREVVVHERVAIGIILVGTLAAGLTAFAAYTEHRPAALFVLFFGIGLIALPSFGRSLLVSGNIVEVRRLFGIRKQNYRTRQIERLIVRGDLAAASASRVLGRRPSITVSFEDGSTIRFSRYASGLGSVIDLARREHLPIDTKTNSGLLPKR